MAESTGPLASWRALAVVFLAFLVGGGLFNTLVINRDPGITSIDGYVYADALLRAGHGEVVVEGMKIGDEALHAVACDGQYGFGTFNLKCGSSESVERLLIGGYTTAYVHPPTYFFATAAVARGVGVVAPGMSPLAAARLANSLWVALGATLMVFLAVLWGGRVWPSAAVVSALLVSPTFVTMDAFVTPDAMGLMVCAAVLIGTTLWWLGRWPWWALAPVGLLAGVVKQTFLLAVVSAVALIGVLWLLQRTRPLREHLVAVSALAGGAVVSVLGWDLIKSAVALSKVDLGPDFFAVPVNYQGFLYLLFTGGAQLSNGGTARIPIPSGTVGLASGLLLALAAAAGGLLFYSNRTDVRFSIAVAGVASLALGGLMVSSLYFLSHRIFLPPEPRYVFGAFPLYALPLLLAARARWVWVGATAIVVLSGVAWLLQPVALAV